MLEDASDNNGLFWLANDINCTDSISWNTSKGFDPIKNFQGTFDGRGYKIIGLHINRPDEDNVGLFSELNDYPSIYNLEIDYTSTITGHNSVGSIAGGIAYIDIFGVKSAATVTGNEYVGGLVGQSYGWDDTRITQSSFSGVVDSTGLAGGIVGSANTGYNFTDVFVNGNIQGSIAGGIVGQSESSCGYRYINNAVALGTVEGSSASGGIVGQYTSHSCYVTELNDSYANTTQPGAGTKGGVVGAMNGASVSITNTHFDDSATTDCIGSSVGSSTPTLECTSHATDLTIPTDQPYASWDFVDVWAEDSGLPKLQFPFASPTGPLAPTDLVVAEGTDPDSIEASWQASSDSGTYELNYYQVQIKKSTDNWDQLAINSSSGTESYDTSGLQLGLTYDIRIRSITEYSPSDWLVTQFSTPDAIVANIETCQELQDLNGVSGAYLYDIKLSNDIDCDGIDFMPLGQSSDWSDSYFNGNFDGQGHKIKNLTINTDSYYTGLFGETYRGTLENVVFEGGSVSGYGYVGSLTGYSEENQISNVRTNLAVTAEDQAAGGIVGYYYSEADADLEGLVSTGDINGYYDVGGLFGYLEIAYSGVDVSLTSSYSTGNVVANNDNRAGGLIGYAYVNNADDDYVPDTILTIQDVYSTANVSGDDYIGGLIGYAESYNDAYTDSLARIMLDRAYSSGSVTATGYGAGGLIGYVDDLSDEGEELVVTNSFATGAISADEAAYALVGSDGYAEDDGTYTADNNYYDLIGTGQLQRDYLDGVENGYGVEGAEYFMNNTTNPPLDTWDFGAVWESHVASLPTLRGYISDITIDMSSAEDSSTIGFTASGCSTLVDWQTQKESDLTVEDPGFSYPVGLVKFELQGCQFGGDATISAVFTTNVNIDDVVIRKYDDQQNIYTTLTSDNSNLVLQPTTQDGKSAIRATYTITDGGLLDQDGEANGVIVDPVGLAQVALTAPNTGYGH